MGTSNQVAIPQPSRRMVFSDTYSPTDDQVADISRYLLEHMEREEMNPVALASGAKTKALELIRRAINEGRIAGINKNPAEAIVRGLYEHTLGLGPIESLLANPGVEQINLRGAKDILVQSNGTWSRVTDDSLLFRDRREYVRVITNLVRRAQKELSPTTRPIMDIRFDRPVLRIHINQTVRGGETSVFIRRGRMQPFTVEQLIKAGNFNRDVANLLIEAAQRLIGCVFIGPVGTGKTVMLEMYINHMPNVPIVVPDDAGDCTPTHPFCLVNDMPATAYSSFEQQILTLGSMVKAALREGDVLGIAEIRGAEEAGVAVSNAPSMRCVVTTFHGNTPHSGLSRLVSLAQTPPSPYAGMSNSEAVARDVAAAFPLVVQLDRSGDKRFVSGIYHNRGWKDNQWELEPLAKAIYHPSGLIEWQIDGSLDEVREVRVLDRIGRIRSNYDTSDPRVLLAKAEAEIAAKNWDAAKHRLYQCLLLHDTEAARSQLVFVLEMTGEAAKAKEEAARSVKILQDHVKGCNWSAAKKLVAEINQRAARAFVRQIYPEYPQVIATIDEGERAVEQAEDILRAAQQTTHDHNIRWDIAEMLADQIRELDLHLLPPQLVQNLQLERRRLLDYLVANAPVISRDYFTNLRENA